MKPVTEVDVQELIQEAKELKESGHPFLDRRWASEGSDGRNAHYRRTYYRFCMLLARRTEPGLVVELGIDEGDCCGHWAHGYPDGRVLGVDIHKDGDAPSHTCREVEQQFPNFEYVRDWTWAALPHVKQAAEDAGGIDILFIDSWHEYDYFAKDWNDYAPLLSPRGIVLVDDLHMGGVSRAFGMLQGKKCVDRTMNPSVPLGVLWPENVSVLTHARRDYMP